MLLHFPGILRPRIPHHSVPHPCGLVGAAILCASALIAQTPTVIPRTTTPIVESNHADGSYAGVWVSGPNYKASFHDGFKFYPHVGKALPHQPVRWRTTSIRLNGNELLIGDATPKPDFQASRCEYDLGIAIERYDVRDEGVEQSFVFAAPLGAGDLIIEGRVETPLELQSAPARQAGLQFRLPDGRGVVSYGRAIAFDAAGKRAPVRSSTDGESITLRLDAEFVATAQYPLTIDPLIANTIMDSGATVVDVDMLHEAVSAPALNGRTWVVSCREVAAGDRDVFVHRIGSGFAGASTLVFKEDSTWDASHGRIALAPGASRTVTVFQTGPAVGPSVASYVAIHVHSVGDMVLRTSTSTPFTTATTNDSRPVVGGRYDQGDKVIIAFQRDNNRGGLVNTPTSAVYASVFDASTNASGSVSVAPFRIRNRPNHDQERPAINRFASEPRWLVAFQTNDGTITNDDWDIPAFLVNTTGATSTGAARLEQADANAQHKVGPQIAGAGGRYLVTYAMRRFELANPKPETNRGTRVFGQRVDWTALAQPGSRPHPAVELDNANLNSLEPGRPAFDNISRSHWCTTVRNQVSDSYVAYKLGFRGEAVESASPIGTSRTPVTGSNAFDTNRRGFQLVWGANLPAGGANSHFVVGTELRYTSIAPASTYGFSCGSGVFADVAEMQTRQHVGSEGLRFALTGAPQDNVATLALSLGRARVNLDPIGVSGCDLLVDMGPTSYLGGVPAAILNGAADFTLDLPESTPPLSLFAQWFYLVPNANPLGLQASDGLELEVDV